MARATSSTIRAGSAILVLSIAILPACGGGHSAAASKSGARVIALDAVTGKQRWSAPVDFGYVVAASAANGRVFVYGSTGCTPQGGTLREGRSRRRSRRDPHATAPGH